MLLIIIFLQQFHAWELPIHQKEKKEGFTNEIEAIANMSIYNIIFKHSWICF
jgi:hypothetical protein